MNNNKPIQPVLPDVDPAMLPECVCSAWINNQKGIYKCGSVHFLATIKIKKVPAILSATGREGYFGIATNVCLKCHTELGDNPETREVGHE